MQRDPRHSVTIDRAYLLAILRPVQTAASTCDRSFGLQRFGGLALIGAFARPGLSAFTVRIESGGLKSGIAT